MNQTFSLNGTRRKKEAERIQNENEALATRLLLSKPNIDLREQ